MSDLTKRLVSAILGAVLVFAVVACGDDDSTPSDSDPPAQVGS